MQVDVRKIDGSLTGEKVDLDPKIFEVKPNDHAIYQVVRSIQANKRQGTHKVKPRNEVRGGGRKPFKQKKTGRARAGTTRSPLWVGGGSIFGQRLTSIQSAFRRK
jgi:large subunit ribosomal protein L4